jgi:hypothetical protein
MKTSHTLLVAMAAWCCLSSPGWAQTKAASPAAIAAPSPAASPTPPPAPLTPADYAGKTFDELLKTEEFNTAYRAVMVKTPLARAGWPFRDSGWPVSMLVTGPHNRQVVVTGTCSSRKCDLNKVQAFFDPISKKMYAHLTLGNKKAWLGKTDPFEKRVLEPMLHTKPEPPSSIK